MPLVAGRLVHNSISCYLLLVRRISINLNRFREKRHVTVRTMWGKQHLRYQIDCVYG